MSYHSCSGKDPQLSKEKTNHCSNPPLYSMDSAYPLSIKKMRKKKRKRSLLISEAFFAPEIGLMKIQKNGSGLSKDENAKGKEKVSLLNN